MAKVAIQKCKNTEETSKSLLEYSDTVTDLIRRRAFDIFKGRDGGKGTDLSDWLEAERGIVWAPASELAEDQKEFKARIAVPGFEAKDIQVSALPDALDVQADATHSHEQGDGIHFCEFSQEKLFRRIGLPAAIDVDNVSASVDNGILRITAQKAEPVQKPRAAAAVA